MDTTKKLLGFTAAAALALFAAACQKKTPNVAPEPDTELQTTVDVSYAAMVITDVDMICSFVGENDLDPKFYTQVPGSGTINPTRDPLTSNLYVPYNSTTCMDGRLRNGTISMNFANPDPNANYYRDYGYVGQVSLINYKVDGWDVVLNNTFFIKNLAPTPAYNPKTTKLSWSLKGDFTLKYRNDPSKYIHCYVDLVKTLANTADPAVLNPSLQSKITWSLAVVEYRGTMWGETSGNVPFTYKIEDTNPLIRNFTCYPEKIVGVALTPAVTPRVEEFHPFTLGEASFTTDGLYPRLVAYGNEQGEYGDLRNDPKDLSYQCDNKGVVTIKGITYPVDFRKDYK